MSLWVGRTPPPKRSLDGAPSTLVFFQYCAESSGSLECGQLHILSMRHSWPQLKSSPHEEVGKAAYLFCC
jgi:hypothetical protein